jgi:hypothetical protein
MLGGEGNRSSARLFARGAIEMSSRCYPSNNTPRGSSMARGVASGPKIRGKWPEYGEFSDQTDGNYCWAGRGGVVLPVLRPVSNSAVQPQGRRILGGEAPASSPAQPLIIEVKRSFGAGATEFPPAAHGLRAYSSVPQLNENRL